MYVRTQNLGCKEFISYNEVGYSFQRQDLVSFEQNKSTGQEVQELRADAPAAMEVGFPKKKIIGSNNSS